MIRIGTQDQAAASRRKHRLANGTGFYKSIFLESKAGARPGPQSFLVEQDADSVILPHFHVQNEFQVVVQGEGSIGRHPVRPLAVHYAGAYTGYGPITAGPEGLWYFTLRPSMDPGARFLPEARGELPPKAPKRHLRGEPAGIDSAGCEEVIAPQPDGIAAWLMRMPADAKVDAPKHAGGLGRFYLVAAGEARIGAGEAGGRWTTTFVTEDEEPAVIQAGAQGAEVLVLQFPA